MAKKVFNHLNRNFPLHNVSKQCPSFTNTVYDSHQAPSQLFVKKDPNLSQEGTTQGDPLAVARYGIALPLISCAQTSSIVGNSKLTGKCLETNGIPRFFLLPFSQWQALRLLGERS